MNNILTEVQDKKTANILLYLISELREKVEGKKKLMKLMFLIEHYDFSAKNIVKNSFLGNNYNIYYYGVFSRKVMTLIDALILSKIVVAGFPLKLSEPKDIVLEPSEKDKVDKVIEKFGDLSGYRLEVDTLNMLGIQPHTKTQFFGRRISDIV